jgi:two-component system LytT family response regulator
MKVIIVDDERPAINILSSFVKKVPFLDLQLATTNAFEAIEAINTKGTDVLLSDIQMPDITGIELIQSLEKPPLIIFTTAYEEYALKG